ncbi:MAG: pyridoxal phosphate-dependent aminotransferase [Clostridia bacterium]|nr:pyridoxal phosphate-dependent aminotransferase [Clostridia bacterium]
MQYSKKCANIQSSVTLAIDAKAKAMRAAGADVVGFGAGEPDFATPHYIVEAAIDALKDGKTKYTAAAGMPLLREAVADFTNKNLGTAYRGENVVISNGAKQALFNALQALCNPGDEVLLFSPYWVSYPELIKMADAVPVFVPTKAEERFAPDLDAFERAISGKTKAVILNDPCNPTGAVFPESALRKIADLAEKHDFAIIADEIYDALVYDGAVHFSVTQINDAIRERTVLINGMSKAYAMTGWRMGYSLSCPALAKRMASLQSHATGNPNTIAQVATLAALTHENPEFPSMLAEFDRRRRYMVETVNTIPGLSAFLPSGAFYVMVSIQGLIGKRCHGRTIDSSLTFAELLLDETKTAVVPGAPFGAEGYIRLSYATDIANIQKGLARIRQFAEGVLSSC